MTRPIAHHLLVAAQLSGVALAIWPQMGRAQSGAHWLVVAASGIVLGVCTLCFNRIGNFSIYPDPVARATLITSGPYGVVRHPMYVALALMMIGISGYNGGARHLLAALLVIAVVVCKALIEERLMSARFPQYESYMQRTWRFVPYLI